MLHDGHQLNGVVAQRFDALQIEIGELAIGADALALLRHADVGLVDHQRRDLLAAIAAVRPLEGPFRRPDHARELMGERILHRIADVGGRRGQAPAPAGDLELDVLAVLQRVRAGKFDLPHAAVQPPKGMRRAVPVVEIADQVNRIRAGRPLAKDPARLCAMKAVVQISVGKRGQRGAVA